MEFIFVDDCTPDKSMEIMWQILDEEFPQRISQVRVFRMLQNSGQAKVRMKGISMASGNYVIHCDSDDMMDPDACRVLYEKAIKDELDVVTCNYMYQCKEGNWRTISGEARGEIKSLLRNPRWSLCNKLVKHSIIEKAAVAPKTDMGEDMVLSIQYLLSAQSIGHIDRVLYYYYFRESSITKAPGKEVAVARWQSLYCNMSIVIDYLSQFHFNFDNGPELVLYKYSVRVYLVPYVNDSFVYHLWLSSFPEINRLFIFVPRIPFETKFWYVMIRLRLYHPGKKVTGFIRKIIHAIFSQMGRATK